MMAAFTFCNVVSFFSTIALAGAFKKGVQALLIKQANK
jgi:hypothetical protein